MIATCNRAVPGRVQVDRAEPQACGHVADLEAKTLGADLAWTTQRSSRAGSPDYSCKWPTRSSLRRGNRKATGRVTQRAKDHQRSEDRIAMKTACDLHVSHSRPTTDKDDEDALQESGLQAGSYAPDALTCANIAHTAHEDLSGGR
jgi:hypothetical protein